MQNETEKIKIPAKEYLSQVQRKREDVRRLNCDMENLYGILYSLGGAKEGERVQASRDNDRFGSIFAKIEEKNSMIEKKAKELIDFIIKVEEEISMLSDQKYVDVLYKRYIQSQSFEQIAVNMGYSYRYVTKIHGYALLEFDKKRGGRTHKVPMKVHK